MKTTKLMAMCFLLICLTAVSVMAYTEKQDFNNEPADWTSRTNNDGTYYEGMAWLPTNLAGAEAGEMWARFHRIKTDTDQYQDTVSYVADTDLGGTLDVAALRMLSARGSFYVDDFTAYPDFGGGIWLGWFRPGGACRMGIMLNDNGADGLGWYACIVDNNGTIIASQYMGSVAKDIRYTFEIEFDNLEGTSGNGRLIARITPAGGATETAVLNLSDKLTNYEFSAFGLARPNPYSVHSPETCIDIFLDDVAYTSNVLPHPQPSPQEYQFFNAQRSDWTVRANSGGGYSEDIGLTNTNYAGSAAGEGHAKFHRITTTTDQPNECISWYADTDLGGKLDVSTQILTASGKFFLNDHVADPDLGTGIWIGWFRPGGGCRMGILINNNHAASAAGWYAGIVNNWGNVVASQYIGSLGKGVKHTFELEFHNRDGFYNKGRLVAKVTPEGGSTETAIIHLQDYLSNYEFSAFGMVRANPSPYEPWSFKFIDMYIDDLIYSSNTTGALPTVPICDAKLSANGASVMVKGIVSAAFYEGYFYVETPDRSSGIRVEQANHGLSVGQEVVVNGTMGTLTNPGERYIAASQVTSTGETGNIAPLAASNKTLGGGDYNYNEAAGTGQKGVEGGSGQNNIGLLMKTTGVVTYVDDATFTLDDGSGVSLTVNCPWGSAPYSGTYVAVTGISSCKLGTDNKLQRVLITRPASDDIIEMSR